MNCTGPEGYSNTKAALACQKPIDSALRDPRRVEQFLAVGRDGIAILASSEVAADPPWPAAGPHCVRKEKGQPA